METVKLGDAVEVAQWPCCGNKIGMKFRVNAMEQPRSGFMRCAKCGVRHESSMDVLDPYAGWTPVAWLKKIEPSEDIPQGTRLG